jgi:hypothetical protein
LSYQRHCNGWLDAVHEEDRKAILYQENATGKSEKHLNIVL